MMSDIMVSMKRGIGAIIKNLREKNGLSQRKLSEISDVSFPQIQRIENGSSREIKIVAAQPCWATLSYYGLAISGISKPTGKTNFKDEFVKAHFFLRENLHNLMYMRHIDAYVGLLLAFLTHYPSKLSELNDIAGCDLIRSWNVLAYKGKHIKVRNISLSILSGRINKIG